MGIIARPHQADAHCATQRNHTPGGGDDSGLAHFFHAADGQEAHQHLRHTEVTQAPRQHGDDGDDAVVGGRAEHGLARLDELLAGGRVQLGRGHLRAGQVAGDGTQEFHGVVDTARAGHGADEHHREREEHEHALNEVGHHHRQVAAHHGVDEHDHRADDHHDVVVETEQRGEQLAHGHEAAAHVHAEEHQDDHGRDGGDHALLVMETLGEEVRNGDGIVGHYRVAAQSPGHKLPVEIGAERQSDGGPHRVGRTSEVGQARQAHQQPAAHVGGFGAQGREPRPHAAPARKVFLGGGVGAFGVDESDGQHGRKIDDHGQQNPEIVGQLRPSSIMTPSGYRHGRTMC